MICGQAPEAPKVTVLGEEIISIRPTPGLNCEALRKAICYSADRRRGVLRLFETMLGGDGGIADGSSSHLYSGSALASVSCLPGACPKLLEEGRWQDGQKQKERSSQALK